MKYLVHILAVLALLAGCSEKKARQSTFALKRDSAAVRAFDEAFRSYLKEKDSQLYHSIFPESKE